MAVNDWIFKAPLLKARIVTVILGIFILLLGLYSHYESSWTYYEVMYAGETVKLHRYCQRIKKDDNLKDLKCPPISMERFYIAVIILCFLFSVVGLIASMKIDFGSKRQLKVADMGYHIVGGILQLTGAILYIMSANQIHDIKLTDSSNIRLKKDAKLAAAAFTIIQAGLFWVTAFLIVKADRTSKTDT